MSGAPQKFSGLPAESAHKAEINDIKARVEGEQIAPNSEETGFDIFSAGPEELLNNFDHLDDLAHEDGPLFQQYQRGEIDADEYVERSLQTYDGYRMARESGAVSDDSVASAPPALGRATPSLNLQNDGPVFQPPFLADSTSFDRRVPAQDGRNSRLMIQQSQQFITDQASAYMQGEDGSKDSSALQPTHRRASRGMNPNFTEPSTPSLPGTNMGVSMPPHMSNMAFGSGYSQPVYQGGSVGLVPPELGMQPYHPVPNVDSTANGTPGPRTRMSDPSMTGSLTAAPRQARPTRTRGTRRSGGNELSRTSLADPSDSLPGPSMNTLSSPRMAAPEDRAHGSGRKSRTRKARSAAPAGEKAPRKKAAPASIRQLAHEGDNLFEMVLDPNNFRVPAFEQPPHPHYVKKYLYSQHLPQDGPMPDQGQEEAYFNSLRPRAGRISHFEGYLQNQNALERNRIEKYEETQAECRRKAKRDRESILKTYNAVHVGVYHREFGYLPVRTIPPAAQNLRIQQYASSSMQPQAQAQFSTWNGSAQQQHSAGRNSQHQQLMPPYSPQPVRPQGNPPHGFAQQPSPAVHRNPYQQFVPTYSRVPAQQPGFPQNGSVQQAPSVAQNPQFSYLFSEGMNQSEGNEPRRVAPQPYSGTRPGRRRRVSESSEGPTRKRVRDDESER